MLLIVGLGNPGAEYAGHRHNVGAMAVDAIHRRHTFSPWRNRFHAEVAEGHLGGDKCMLMKPTTFMNDSGQAVGEAVRFYKLEPDDVVVIHDEIDLAPGKTRVKTGGGVAGHNGLRSVTAHIGNDYRRLRIGVGHPGHKDLVNRHVLHDFAKADREWLDPLLAAIADNAELLVEDKDALLATRLAAAVANMDQAKQQKPSESKAQAPKPESESEPAKGPFAGLRRLFSGKDSA
jgi:PTH1 family peptidyl-tRNA hydrolase